jgi:hypothetical protein
MVHRPLDVSHEAARLGFALIETIWPRGRRWQWMRGRDTNWPSFATKGEALAWMEERIREGTLFHR